MTGLNRNLSEKIERLLESSPVVMLVGARQTGKTTLSQMLRSQWKYFKSGFAVHYYLVDRTAGGYQAM